MATPCARTADDTSLHVSLIDGAQSEDTELDKYLNRLELFLRLLGFCQYSPLSSALSWLAFVVIGVVVPFLLVEYSYCADCEKYQIRVFELQILISQALLAAISLFSISRNLRKHGLRKLLFVDRYRGHLAQFLDLYIQKIRGFFRVLAVWTLPCLLLKIAREVVRAIYVHDDPLWQSVTTVAAVVVSWTYLNMIYLSGAALFNLVCNLQVIQFENYGKLLERDLDVSVYIEEHSRLTQYLSKISHRFRMYLFLNVLVVTASLFVALLQTTGNKGLVNWINGGDFGVSSIIEFVGLCLCLHAAAKISHRAQGIASVASRWHAYVTCNSGGASQVGTATNGGNLEASNPTSALPSYYSESDVESADCASITTNTQLASYMSTYHKRQSLVTYLQTNHGGFTIYGWTVDRILINTLFFIEFSLFSFVLGKTITI